MKTDCKSNLNQNPYQENFNFSHALDIDGLPDEALNSACALLAESEKLAKELVFFKPQSV